MTDARTTADQAGRVREYYAAATDELYLRTWNAEHIHFGVFEPGDCPEPETFLPAHAGMNRALERTIEVTVEPAGICPGDHVVDAGCGVGGTSMYLARTRACLVTGINLSEEQLAIARRRADEAEVAGEVTFEWGDCSRRLPVGDSAADIIVNIESACHYRDRQQFLHEVRRVLRNGGGLVAMDWLARESITASEYERFIAPLDGPWALHGLETEQSYREKLRTAGLEVQTFSGFGGKDHDNLKVVEWCLQRMRRREKTGPPNAMRQRWMAKLAVLARAWRSGCFTLGRYYAVKQRASLRNIHPGA